MTNVLSYAEAIAIVEDLIRTAPPLEERRERTEDEMRWLARCEALLNHIKSKRDLISFRTARATLNSPYHSRSAIMEPLLNTYYGLELHLPDRTHSGFIPSGDTWNGYAALVRLVQKGASHLLLIDQYMDGSLFTELLPHSDLNGGEAWCLTTKGQYHHSLVAAHTKWESEEIGKQKPARVKLAPPKSLHDRLIIIDRSEVWLISQSFKDVGKSSPASLTKADADLSSAKLDHYFDLWDRSESPR